MQSEVEAVPESNTYVLYRTYPELDEGLLMGDVHWFLISVIVVYLAFVLKIGPDIMRKRKPFQLKKVLLYFNAAQVVISIIIAALGLRSLWASGIFPKTTPQLNVEFRKLMAPVSQAFYLSKFTELFDTVFFVLRKKDNQISFLHVYHHASVIIGTWVGSKYGLNQTACWAAFMNAAVHIVMYFYYFMAALGPQYHKYLTWKKHITVFQIVQFLSVFGHQTISLLVTKGEYSVVGLGYIYFSAIMFTTLFCNFYRTSYKKKQIIKEKKIPVEENGISNGKGKYVQAEEAEKINGNAYSPKSTELKQH